MMYGTGMMGMMVFMFLFGLLLIVLFVVIVVAIVKWLWASNVPLSMNDREKHIGNSQKALRQRRDWPSGVRNNQPRYRKVILRSSCFWKGILCRMTWN